LEETKSHGIRSKAPKTKASRRDITLPDRLVEALRDFREQLKLRFKLGAGKLPEDALMFAGINGAPSSQKRYCKDWSAFKPEMGFHNLRLTARESIGRYRYDLKRLVHAKPDITLRIYAHLFTKDDGKAAAAINAALIR